MIDYINSNRNEHIMTIEDPIEFLHRDKKSIVNQREVEVDTQGLPIALRSALRQDPDVILVGEMRDYETVETALTAAETGHLVLSTLHTLDATETINRIIAIFPPHQQKQIRLQLAAVLKAVISLRLMPRADGLGRVPAVEILISTALVRDCIENKEKTKLIKDAIAAGTSQYGMQTFDQSLFGLYKSGLITLRRGAATVHEPERVQAEAAGDPVHVRRRAGGDGRVPGSAGGGRSDVGELSVRLLEPAARHESVGAPVAQRRPRIARAVSASSLEECRKRAVSPAVDPLPLPRRTAKSSSGSRPRLRGGRQRSTRWKTEVSSTSRRRWRRSCSTGRPFRQGAACATSCADAAFRAESIDRALAEISRRRRVRARDAVSPPLGRALELPAEKRKKAFSTLATGAASRSR